MPFIYFKIHSSLWVHYSLWNHPIPSRRTWKLLPFGACTKALYWPFLFHKHLPASLIKAPGWNDWTQERTCSAALHRSSSFYPTKEPAFVSILPLPCSIKYSVLNSLLIWGGGGEKQIFIAMFNISLIAYETECSPLLIVHLYFFWSYLCALCSRVYGTFKFVMDIYGFIWVKFPLTLDAPRHSMHSCCLPQFWHRHQGKHPKQVIAAHCWRKNNSY